MIVIVELKGTLQTLSNTRKLGVELEEKTTISTLIHTLNKAEFFVDREAVDESNLLIMANGKEISVLKGLQTELKDSDVITLIPISHGG